MSDVAAYHVFVCALFPVAGSNVNCATCLKSSLSLHLPS